MYMQSDLIKIRFFIIHILYEMESLKKNFSTKISKSPKSSWIEIKKETIANM